MHPVTYFIQDTTIDCLCDHFGVYLEKLDRSQQVQCRVLLTNFLLGQQMMGPDYTICDAWEDSSLHLLVEDEAVVEFADILQELTIAQAEGLLSALAEQCTVGNSRLKTAVETMTDTLLSYGMPLEFASKAAVIFKEVDGVRDRTREEQQTIDEMYKFLGTAIRERREAEAAK